MKRLVFLMLLILAVSTVAGSELIDAIEGYYRAYADEDMDAYLAAQVKLSDAALLKKQETLKHIWDMTDILSYEISGFSIDEYKDLAFVSYTVGFEMRFAEEDKIIKNKDRMAAILLKEDGWKIAHTGTEPKLRAALQEVMISEGIFPTDEEKIISCGDGLCEVEEDCEVDCTVKTYVCDGCSYEGDMIDLRKSDDDEKVRCDFDDSMLLPIQEGDLPKMPIDSLFKDSKIKIMIDEKEYFLDLGEGRYKAQKSLEPDYIVTADSCTVSSILDGEMEAAFAYKQGLIKIKGQGLGSGFKGWISELIFGIYSWFRPEPYNLVIEAESGTLENGGPYTFIGATSRGPGELYLGDGGARAAYVFESNKKNNVNLYLLVSDDGMHQDGARSVIFNVNGKDLEYNHKSMDYIAPESYWGKELLGRIELKKGENKIVITKPKATSAAFVMDKMILVEG